MAGCFLISLLYMQSTLISIQFTHLLADCFLPESRILLLVLTSHLQSDYAMTQDQTTFAAEVSRKGFLHQTIL